MKLERAKVVYKKALDRPFCTLSLLAADGTQLEPPVRCAFVNRSSFSQHLMERAAACRPSALVARWLPTAPSWSRRCGFFVPCYEQSVGFQKAQMQLAAVCH